MTAEQRALLDEIVWVDAERQCGHAGVKAASTCHHVKTVTEIGWRSSKDRPLLAFAIRQHRLQPCLPAESCQIEKRFCNCASPEGRACVGNPEENLRRMTNSVLAPNLSLPRRDTRSCAKTGSARRSRKSLRRARRPDVAAENGAVIRATTCRSQVSGFSA